MLRLSNTPFNENVLSFDNVRLSLSKPRTHQKKALTAFLYRTQKFTIVCNPICFAILVPLFGWHANVMLACLFS